MELPLEVVWLSEDRPAPPRGGAVDDPVTGPEYLLDLAAREDPEWSDPSAYTVGF